MKTKNRILIFPFVLMGALLMLMNSCKKDDVKDDDATDLISNNGITFNPNLTYGTVTDVDGNVYKTIKIGTQTWMAENLKTTKYNNGDPIPNAPDNSVWSNLSTGAYRNFGNDVNNANIYGRLYNWYAASGCSGNIAPAGWHVASYEEWKTLTSYLVETGEIGYKLKETGANHWKNLNSKSTNSSGFTALPGGFCKADGTFGNYGFGVIGNGGYWWTFREGGG